MFHQEKERKKERKKKKLKSFQYDSGRPLLIRPNSSDHQKTTGMTAATKQCFFAMNPTYGSLSYDEYSSVFFPYLGDPPIFGNYVH